MLTRGGEEVLIICVLVSFYGYRFIVCEVGRHE